METNTLPLLIEPDTLEASLHHDNILIVDMNKAETYLKIHIPGAVQLDYLRIIDSRRPVMGLVPDDATLTALFSSLGIDADTHVIAYDDEGGGRAARLLWTLEVAGHRRISLLNGGLHSWANEGHPLDRTPVPPTAKTFHVNRNNTPSADSSYIREQLNNADCRLLDVRSPEEYSGLKRFAERGGHIPGAVNLNWTEAIDINRNMRFKSDEALQSILTPLGITPDREVIVYCQTHHRSAHSYMVLKHLGYERIKGYPGSWSDWGNNPELPVE
jgi:thiosulfate/3-mercaptopyruvate sulfurtransferase